VHEAQRRPHAYHLAQPKSLRVSRSSMMATSPSAPSRTVQAVRPAHAVDTLQKLPYFIGVSGHTVGAQGLSMHLVVIPPGARAEPHLHVGYETAIYILQGRVQTRYGEGLAQSVVSEAGDFLFIPPGVPHEAINLSASEAARAIVARNHPADQDKVVPYRPPGGPA
jgi:uncharacterized RmlC-like cupin family protein